MQLTPNLKYKTKLKQKNSIISKKKRISKKNFEKENKDSKILTRTIIKDSKTKHRLIKKIKKKI